MAIAKVNLQVLETLVAQLERNDLRLPSYMVKAIAARGAKTSPAPLQGDVSRICKLAREFELLASFARS